MAEEKKKILIHTADGDHVVAVGEHKPKQTFGAMPVKDYVAAVADPDGLPQAGSVGAVVSALPCQFQFIVMKGFILITLKDF